MLRPAASARRGQSPPPPFEHGLSAGVHWSTGAPIFSQGDRMIALAATLALLAQAPQGGATAEKGKVSGKVTISGLAPKLATLPVTRDIKSCGTNKPDESLVVGQAGGVKNAVVWIADGPKPPRGFKQKYRLD